MKPSRYMTPSRSMKPRSVKPLRYMKRSR